MARVKRVGRMRHWESRELRSPERALLLRMLLRFRSPLLRGYASVPVPQEGCPLTFGPKPWSRAMPLGALYLLWDRWPQLRSTCQRCSGRIIGYTFALGPETGALVGCCIHCSRYALNVLPHGSEIFFEVEERLRGTPFPLVGIRATGAPGERHPLLDALATVGGQKFARRLVDLVHEPSLEQILTSEIDVGSAEEE